MIASNTAITGLLLCALLSPPDGTPWTGMPFLSATEQGTVRTWLDRGPDGTVSLRLQEHRAGEPPGPVRSVVSGSDVLANWADFPSVLRDNTGRLWAQWLVRTPGEGFAYEVRVARSRDGGVTWSEATTPHTDRSAVEHGFVSMVPWKKGVALVWLDGREMAGQDHDHGGGPAATRLYYTTIDPRGRKGEEVLLDDRVCDCCQTDMTHAQGRTLVAYRDRSPAEIRDIRVLRRENGRWHPSVLVAEDGWEFAGCPVNGPALAAEGDHVAVAWFTAAGGQARSFVAFSADGGRTFGERIRVDDGRTLGRMDVAMLPDATALVTWMEAVEKRAEVRVRAWGPEGPRGPAVTLGVTEPGRSSGFPRLSRSGERVEVGWTDTRTGRQVSWQSLEVSALRARR